MKEWKLVDESGNLVAVGSEVTSFRGNKMLLCGGTPPARQGSTGRVYVAEPGSEGKSSFFPSVFRLKWV